MIKACIIIPVCNNTTFIELQKKCFDRFLLDEVDLIYINDAMDSNWENRINHTCLQLNIRVERFPQYLHRDNSPSTRNSDVITWAIQKFGKDYDIVSSIDSDIFLFQEFSIRKYMENFDLAFIPQHRQGLEYMWIGFFFLKNIPDFRTISFNNGPINGIQLDSGGTSHYYIISHPNLKINRLSHLCSCGWNKNTIDFSLPKNIIEFCEQDPLLANANYYAEIYDKNFLHFRAGSNWTNLSSQLYEKRVSLLKEKLA